MMREIITLQLGNLSNYTATHFWNVQESYFTYDDQSSSPIDHNILWRAGLGHDGCETFMPRTVIYDLKGAFGSLRKINTLYDAMPQVDAAAAADRLSLWSGSPTVHKQPAVDPGPYQQSLNAGLEPAQLTASVVRHWSDFSRVYFHPKSLVQLYDYELDSTIRPFDRFAMGVDLFDSLAKEHDVLDRDWRPFAEECDNMQGIQVVTSLDDAWAGFASSYLEALRDEFPKSSIWVWPLQTPQPPCSPGTRQMRLLNTAYFLNQACSSASAIMPLTVPDEDCIPPEFSIDRSSLWSASGLLSAAMETATLPSRRTSEFVPLSDMAECLSNGRSRRLVKTGISLGHQALEPDANPLDLSPSYPSRKRARGDFRRERIFGQLFTSRGRAEDAKLNVHVPEQQQSPLADDNPVTRRYAFPLPFPLLSSFPRLHGQSRTNSADIPVQTVLSTDTSIATRLKSLRAQVCPSVPVAEREDVGNGLLDIVEAYQDGWLSDSDEGDDDI
ncbi:hypothetical protein CDD80_3046 [Ophiocordyceps camponoti-rufipedis]|uniref:DML1/Misato tubulin domain-containing protein n=1 Tax=Ophiocordyceps camponoti-rufipedis TaxID=2004952 RepID=A0A2C5YY46_9HYPO|nr:hypothetical protein CDD80_3046 [Ophiocordyceps camponoti-rufipedis]